MTTEQAREILSEFNRWRRGAEIKMPDTKLVGKALDKAIEVLSEKQDQ